MTHKSDAQTATHPRSPHLLRWLPATLWAGVIFWGSSQPGSAVPGRFAVLGHLSEYAILGALVAVAHRGERVGRGLLTALAGAVAIASAYGITDELHQLFVPGRTADPADWALDTLGAAIGIALLLLVWRVARSGSTRP